MNIHSSYFKRFFFHNLIYWATGLILLIVLYFLGSYKMIFSEFLINSTIGILLLMIIFLAIDFFIVYKYIKPENLKLIEGKLILNDKELNIGEINSITPICYSKTNWFINVVEINYNDQIISLMDLSQYGNTNSKSIKILTDKFPYLKEKITENITRRKFIA